MYEHLKISELTIRKPLKKWLIERYGKKNAVKIWKDTHRRYNSYLRDLPDYGGKKNGHAMAIYGGLLIFAFYPSLPDKPPVSELQELVSTTFFGKLAAAGRVFDLNNSVCMRIIDMIFRRSGDRDRKDIVKYPCGFINVDVPYDKKDKAARYCFTQCPNAEFAKKHGLLHVLPLLCNSDYYGISGLHGTLIRRGTCGTGDICDYCIVGNKSRLADKYTVITDEMGFLRSVEKDG